MRFFSTIVLGSVSVILAAGCDTNPCNNVGPDCERCVELGCLYIQQQQSDNITVFDSCVQESDRAEAEEQGWTIADDDGECDDLE